MAGVAKLMNFKKIWRHALLISPDVPLRVPPMLANVVLVNSAVPAGTKRSARVSPRRSPECAVTIVRIEERTTSRSPSGARMEKRGEKRGRKRGRGNSEEDDSPLGWSRSNFEFLRKKGGLCARVGVRAELPRVLFRSPSRGVAASIDPSSGTTLPGPGGKKRNSSRGKRRRDRRIIPGGQSKARRRISSTGRRIYREIMSYTPLTFLYGDVGGESSPLPTSPSSGRVHFSLSSRGGPMF